MPNPEVLEATTNPLAIMLISTAPSNSAPSCKAHALHILHYITQYITLLLYFATCTVSTSASCRGSRPSWALVGAGCSNQMQVAQGQGLVRVCALVQAAIGCCILLLLVPKTVLTLCNLRWLCFSCHQLVQRPHLHSWGSSPATCTGGVSSYAN